MNLYEIQAQLDLKKWLDSESVGQDTCNQYDYCKFCDKNENLPCARAYQTMQDSIRAQESDITQKTQSLGKKFDFEKVMSKKNNRKSLTFAEKHALSDDILKQRYEILKNTILSLSDKNNIIKSRLCKQCDTFRVKGKIVAKITIIGQSLRLNLNLDTEAPEFCDGKTPHQNTGNKKVYECVPFQFKVNSKLALKRALVLVDYIK